MKHVIDNGLQGRWTRTTGYNKVLPKWRQKCYYETFVLYSTAVLLLNFSANNPPHRQCFNVIGHCRTTQRKQNFEILKAIK